jgi:predicted helicase
MTLSQYIQSINERFKRGNATEHTFRGDLQQLIESLMPDISATNEPKRQKCGAPDYILMRKDIPVGFIEAKDIGDIDLDGAKKTGNKEQFDRYKASLSNILFTDYLDFHLYRNGFFITKIAVGEIQNNRIVPLTDNFAAFTNLIKDFCTTVSQTITSSKKLAEMMAGKARLLSEVIEKAIVSDEESYENSSLRDQMNAFKEILIHDITPKAFADVYAQTIAYGMFAARYHDPTLPTFSREETATLIPKSNPFLRKLFAYIAGPDLDDRIKWIVDSLVDIFLATDVAEILTNFGKSTKTEDPIIHFYETFLSEYDSALRKSRGVWYTPQPVVNFIVRAVDDILKTEFDLPQGLADTGNIDTTDLQNGVQILDPATGTGTFLCEVIKHIYKKFEGQQGIWSNYVEKHLLPRLNGFELLMASYAMAHLKLDLLLAETGYKPTANQRFRVFLTNSLEEQHPDTNTLFARWLSDEANEANHIKRDTPVMVVLGNPPYSIISSNLSLEQKRIIEKYKFVNNERVKERGALQLEKNLNDDYIKFIGLGEDYIIKNQKGVLAFVNNHNFLDGTTFRGIRWHLLKTFDAIYIIDLHGSAKKNEISPDGSPDRNVFDIQQGVSINIFVKTGQKKPDEPAKVFHYDLFGERQFKYDFLSLENLKTIHFELIRPESPNYVFIKRDYNQLSTYNQGIPVKELFNIYSTGIITARDNMVIGDDIEKIIEKVSEFQTSQLTNNELCRKIGISEKKGWNIAKARKSLLNLNLKDHIQLINYRPFDSKYIFYHNSLVWTTAMPVMQHFLNEENIGLCLCKQFKIGSNYVHVFISNKIIESSYVSNKTSEITYFFPLYLYPDNKSIDINEVRKSKELKYEESRIILENFYKDFSKIKKMYESVENPDKELKSYYKEQEKQYLKLSADVEKFKKQLEINSNGTLFESESRKPNLNLEIVNRISEGLGLTFSNEKEKSRDKACLVSTFSPIDILDYIYAILHSPTYREKYKEFLKIDFPRVPHPKNIEIFWQLVKLGGELRQIHLMESPVVEKYITQYPADGSNTVKRMNFVKVQNFDKVGNVYINENQYFANVPEVAWNFYIGGYQPAQKWLKDRKDRTLDFDDILHYQKIIVALTETDRLMKEIGMIDIE